MKKLLRYAQFGLLQSKHFFPGRGEATVAADRILIRNYPFAPSRAYPTCTLYPSDISSISFGAPPLLQVDSDFICLSREHETVLRAFAKTHKVATRSLNYNWDLLLEVFLDKEHSLEEHERLYQQLAQRGLGREEVDAIRDEVREPMMYYNFGLMVWEWIGFGLHDVLSVMKATTSSDAFEGFYWRAMEIEARGDSRPS